jgi:hypothetical protein
MAGGEGEARKKLRFSRQSLQAHSAGKSGSPSKLSNQELSARFSALQSQLHSFRSPSRPRSAPSFSGNQPSTLAELSQLLPAEVDRSSNAVPDRSEAPNHTHVYTPTYAHVSRGKEANDDGDLRSQLEAEKARSKALQQQLQEEQERVQSAERSLKEHLAGRLSAAAHGQQPTTDSSSGVAPASSSVDGAKHRLIREGKRADVSAEELEQLRKDVQEQESLIRAYQAENEAAMHRLKSSQQQARAREEELVAENSRLQAEINSLRGSIPDRSHVCAAPSFNSSPRPFHISSCVLFCVNVHTQDGGQNLQRVLQLEQQLEHAKEEAASKQDELRREVKQVKEEKQSLLSRLESFDSNAPERDAGEAKEAEGRFAKEREQYKSQVDELQRKVDWYAENQELISDKDKTISKLEQRIDELTGGGQRRQNGASTSTDAEDEHHGQKAGASGSSPQQLGPKRLKQRVKELTQENNELRSALEERNPSSTAALLSAVRPKPEESEHVRSLEKQVSKLKQDLKAKDDEKEATVRSLRQEHEKVKSQYDSQLKRARAQAASASGGSKSSRVKELEQQIADLRDFYGKKVKHLQSQLETERSHIGGAAPQQQQHGSRRGARSGRGSSAAHDEGHDAEDGNDAPECETANAEVQACTEAAESTNDASAQVELLMDEHQSVHGAVVSAEPSSSTEAEHGGEAADSSKSMPRIATKHAAEGAESIAGDNARASKMARQQLQEAYSEVVERSAQRIASLERQLEDARKQAEGLSSQEGERANRAERRVQELESEKAELEQSLQPQSQRVREELKQIDRKLVEMQRGMPEDAWSYTGARERQWLWIANQARRMGAAEASEARANAERAVKAKNDELNSFRRELDSILAAALAHQASEHSDGALAEQHDGMLSAAPRAAQPAA